MRGRQGEKVEALTCFDEYSGHVMEIQPGQGFVGRCSEQEEAVLVLNMLKNSQFNPNLGI